MENTETRQAALRAAMEESRWDVVAYLIVSGIEGVQKRLRAVIAADNESEPKQPAPAGDVPEWFCEVMKEAEAIPKAGDTPAPWSTWQRRRAALVWDRVEAEITRRVAEATKESQAEQDKLVAYFRSEEGAELGRHGDHANWTPATTAVFAMQQYSLAIESLRQLGETAKNRDAEIERLKAQLTKWESEPVGKLITELRDEERESKNRDIAKLKAELAEATKPIEFESANIRELDGMKMIYFGDAQAAVRRERAARLAAERRLALTREAWRHRWVGREGNDQRERVLTDADIDAAIAAHQKSKADAAGGDQ